MPRDPLAWLPLLRHWTRCLGEGPDVIVRMGDLGALPELEMAALLPGLGAMANGTRFEVIVADDASSDATSQLVGVHSLDRIAGARLCPGLRAGMKHRERLRAGDPAAAVARAGGV